MQQETQSSFSFRKNLPHPNKILRVTLLVCSTLALYSLPADASKIPVGAQQALYRDAVKALKQKDQGRFVRLKAQLVNYPLYPYLEYYQLLPNIKTASLSQVEAFQKKHAALPFTKNIHNQYLQLLAQRQQWHSFLKFQPQPPTSESSKCNYYYAQSQVGNKKTALAGGQTLYLSGRSVNIECDKLFSWMKKQNAIDDTLILKRMLLAFERGNRTLLNFLSNQLSNKQKMLGSKMVMLLDNPQALTQHISSRTKRSATEQKIVYLTLKRQARQNPLAASRQFATTLPNFELSRQEQMDIANTIIHNSMSSNNAELVAWRDAWLAKSRDEALLERRFRLALTNNDWIQMQYWYGLLPQEARKQNKWRYWQARLLRQQGQMDKAQQIFQSMLGERDFYSAAAATHLRKPIVIPFESAPFKAQSINGFKSALTRISELHAVNQSFDAQKEWQAILQKASHEQKINLASYASKQGWHEHAVQATISGQLWGHLEQRFPLAHKNEFKQFSQMFNVSITTLLALSRQESAFNAKARSSAGARGLMQLMPATAKATSKKLGIPLRNLEALHDPKTNIRLGSNYLSGLLDRFEQNRILAFAAYNAGPHRVNQWLNNTKGNLDVFGFIEGIPFRETRGYVQNVLMYEIYYRKLLGMPLTFLQNSELSYSY
ncbi:MAG: murein transglycosylase [Enterovibrio sp.]